jgi:hypothetical protein
MQTATATKTKTKAASPKFAKASEGKVVSTEFALEAFVAAYQQEIGEINARIEKGSELITKGSVLQADNYVNLGNVFIRIKRDWEAKGKPVSLTELKKELGVSSPDWSRYSRLAEWADENADELNAMSAADRAQAILDQLAELRSMSKAKVADRKASAEADEGEGETEDDESDVDATIDGYADELAAAIYDQLADIPEAKQEKWLKAKLLSFAKDCRKL